MVRDLITPEAATEPMLPRPFRVTSRRVETPDTVTLALDAEDGHGLAFRPGQFTMLYVFGVGEVPISISGDPHDPGRVEHTVRSVGNVTEAIVGLGVGDPVGMRGPYGTGWPMTEAEGMDLLVIAGSIGLAPLRPTLVDALTRRDEFASVSLLYGSRSPGDLLFREQLHAWRGRFDVEIEVTVDRPDPGWFGDVGVVTNLLPRVPLDPTRTVAMVCGPEIMMKAVSDELTEYGLAEDRIYVSLERNMKCAIGFCGHCQYGPDFICRDGPVLAYSSLVDRMKVPRL